MVADTELAVAARLGQLLRHLSVTQAHVAARLTADWSGLATTHPEVFASLTLVCPTAIDTGTLRPLSPQLLVVAGGAQPGGATRVAGSHCPGCGGRAVLCCLALSWCRGDEACLRHDFFHGNFLPPL
jgi:hypothetical protein